MIYRNACGCGTSSEKSSATNAPTINHQCTINCVVCYYVTTGRALEVGCCSSAAEYRPLERRSGTGIGPYGHNSITITTVNLFKTWT